MTAELRCVALAWMGVLSSCVHAGAARDAEAWGAEIDGADQVLLPGATVVIGDIHGTREIPRFVGELATVALRRGPVVVGLEMPAEPELEAYLHSDGGPEAKQALLAGKFWVDPLQDGRRSVAAFELLAGLHRARRAGAPLEVFFFDAEGTKERTRDQQMAATILAKRAARPDALFVLMMGNLHARKLPGNPWGDKDYAWLTTLLPKTTLALNVRAPRGTAWVQRGMTRESCGPSVASTGPGALGTRRVTLAPTSDGAYDGTFDVESMTASPPAAFPALAVGLDERVAGLLRTADVLPNAMKAYEHGDFEGCARLLSTLAEPSADALYSHACCLARAGKTDEAFARLQAALASGFDDQKTLQTDEDLRSLHADPRWPKP